MEKTNKISLWLLLLIGSLAVVQSRTFVYAVAGENLSVFPAITKTYPNARSWFVYEADPGTVVTDKIELINTKTRSATLNIAVLDGATTKDGGYTLVGGKEENKDIGTWATLSKEIVVLPAKSKAIVDLTIKVPDNADVGSHPGGVVIWENAASNSGEGAGMLTVVTRVAARVYLTVPGDIVRQLEISNVRHMISKGVLYFYMAFHNAGNVTLSPEADIKLRGILGSAGEQKGSQFGMILRGGTISSRVPWQKKAPKFGRFVADFRVHYGEKDFKGDYVKDEYQDVRYVFWLIPWMTIIWSIIAILLLLFIRKFWMWILIRQRLNTKTTKHTVKKGETLSSIAQFYKVDTKKVAKFNLFKWPYDLFTGDVLLIPQGKMIKEEQKLVVRHPGPTGQRPSSDSGSRPRFRIKSGMTRGVPGMTGKSELEAVIAEAGDNVKTVAEFAGVSIKEIITINRLNWPYHLRVGQELFIPTPPNKVKSEEVARSSQPVKIKVKSATHRNARSSAKKLSNKLNKSNKSSPRKPKK